MLDAGMEALPCKGGGRGPGENDRVIVSSAQRLLPRSLMFACLRASRLPRRCLTMFPPGLAVDRRRALRSQSMMKARPVRGARASTNVNLARRMRKAMRGHAAASFDQNAPCGIKKRIRDELIIPGPCA